VIDTNTDADTDTSSDTDTKFKTKIDKSQINEKTALLLLTF